MAKATVAIIAVTSPTRNSMTTGMMKQKDGMVCSVSMIGVTMRSTRSLRAAQDADRDADQAGDDRRDAAQIERRHRLLPQAGRRAEARQQRDEQRRAASRRAASRRARGAATTPSQGRPSKKRAQRVEDLSSSADAERLDRRRRN